MAPVRISHVVSFTSQDPRHPAENLLAVDGPRPWLSSPQDRSGRLRVELQLERAVPIGYVDVGNCGCAFVQMEVGRSCWAPDRPYLTLLPTTTLMTPADSKLGENRSAVRMFKHGDFLAPAAGEPWDRVRVTCSQPFRPCHQFGLAFLRLRSPLERTQEPGAPAPGQSQEPPLPPPSSPPLPPPSLPWLASPAIRKTFFSEPQPSPKEVVNLQSRLQQLQPGTLTRPARMVLAAARRARLTPAERPESCRPEEPTPTSAAAPGGAPDGQKVVAQKRGRRQQPDGKKKQKPLASGRSPRPAGPGRGRRDGSSPRWRPPKTQETPTQSQTAPSPSLCPICAGNFPDDFLPLHAATCGEEEDPSMDRSLPPPSWTIVSSSSSSEDDSEDSTPSAWVQCPLCQVHFPAADVESHASTCGESAPAPENPWMWVE
ncbi:Xrcc1 N-terminal domain containing 1 [Ornithorhynchus anatinus]|uniref:XRCC1 N-terminal domain containing 1, N-terminal like n=1 Tax=Ornithorhynchus anatinus TaxID=9258 RepID=A0A6I8NHK4_ORNAN|nr:protein XNDC1N [Ornithorhynchus anatinus]